ncbi:MAG: redoxin domain-containing protein [Halobacteriota archaeon]
MLSAGDTAPDFICPAVRGGDGQVLQLVSIVDDHRATLLYFCPGAFVPACTAELQAMVEAGWDDVDELAIVCLTADGVYAHAAYAAEFGFPFRFGSDTHGSIADSYGVLAAEWQGQRDVPKRAAVLLDGWTVSYADAVDDAVHEVSPSPIDLVSDRLASVGIQADPAVVEYRTDS